MHDHSSAGDQRLQSGVALARSGIRQYQSGNTGGVDSVDQGRGMMVQGMGMMGLGCCLFDGSVADVSDGGLVGGCASMMGPGGAMAQPTQRPRRGGVGGDGTLASGRIAAYGSATELASAPR